MKLLVGLVMVVLAVACGTPSARLAEGSAATAAELEKGWADPPQSARTRVWWHWMNGNVTKDGVRKDLEWMKRIGLGGVHNFDAALGTPTIVDKRLIYMDEGWQEAFQVAVRTADSLGLEFTIASAPGWSSTGGPWVEPKDAMKRLVWRTVEGSGPFDVVFPEPFTRTGAFQNGAAAGRGEGAELSFYEDISVIAVRQPEGRRSAASLGAKVTSSGGDFTLDQLTDGDIANGSLLPRDDKAGYAWVGYEFPEPVTVRSLTLAGSGTVLESSEDGVHYATVCPIQGGRGAESTLGIPATTARFFRLRVDNPRGGGGGFFGMGGGRPGPPPAGTLISEFELHPYTRVHRFEDKAGFTSAANLTASPTPASDEAFPTPADVVDVTEHFKEGKLRWDAPEGTWKIYRFGYALTGKQNHPAPLEATGLEVDKLDPLAWTRYFRTYLDMYKKASGGQMGARGVQYVLTDSYEAECETWTPAMFSEFKNRRGYDLTAWMPVLAGEVIGSPAESDAFLWDWRQTLGNLISDNYALLSKIAREEYGMLGTYVESHEGGRAFVGDGMDLKRAAQVPMGAMWVTAPWVPMLPDGTPDMSVYDADDKESASVAHLYGQNVAAAESMTAPGQGGLAYSYHPGNLKYVADREMSSGINRFVIHESAHQPDDVHVPGMSLGGIGQWFNRHDTWAEMAGVWADYMARSCFMLQAGHSLADILYYYGEDSNVTAAFNRPPQIPSGYQWDYLNPDALLNHISYDRGKLVSDSGTTYQVIWMDRNMDYVSVPVLRKLAALAKEGAWIGGAKPKFPASLTDGQAEFDALVADLFGRKNVVETSDLQEFLDKAGVAPDVLLPEGFRYLHRTLSDSEVYWINKPSREDADVTLSFRTAGRRPTLWHPDNGTVEDVSYSVKDGRTEVKLHLVPDDAVFVVFSGKGKSSETVPAVDEKMVLEMTGSWQVAFQEKRGAPATATFDTLGSYTDSEVFGIKYFSGVATYTKTVHVDALGERMYIDLGQVCDLAEVYVNGTFCGTAWKQPYRVDVTDALKSGDNQLEIKVANTWPNRLIGDEQPGAIRVAWTDSRAYRAEDPLRPAGLLGPVCLLEANR